MKNPAGNSTTWRFWLLVIFIVCLSLLGYALYLQHAIGLEPCPLCILQRIAFIAVGLLALAGAVHNPIDRGRLLYAGTMFVFAITGAATAARHTWLQYNPDPLAGCGPDLTYTLENFPLSQAFPLILKGSGPCSSVDWVFLGLSMPMWAMLFLSVIALTSLWLLFQNRHTR